MKKLALTIGLTFIFALTLTSFHKGNDAAKQDQKFIKIEKQANKLSYDYGDEDSSIIPFPPREDGSLGDG